MNELQPTWLFLCGVGRSGTTALRTSLGTHPEIYYNGFENNIVQDVVEAALKNCTMQSRKNAMVVSQDSYDQLFRELICSLVWPDNELSKRPVHMAAINPTPAQMNYMVQMLPGCKFVGLIRHGIEVVSSRMEYKSFSQHDFASQCKTWNRSADVFHWGQQNPEIFLLMRQEWFYDSAKFEQQAKALHQWLGISDSDEPHKQMLGSLKHPTSADFEIQRRDFRNTEAKAKKQYFLSKRERWRNWTAEQRRVFEQTCAKNMQALGYEIPW